MKKVISYILVFSMILSFFSPITVDAATYVGTVTASSGVRVRTGPGTSHSQVDFLVSGAKVDMVNLTLHKDEGGCSGGWYQIYYDTNKVGYSCAAYFNISEKVIYDDSREPVTDYEKVLDAAGFPASYWPSLTALHEQYPSWTFKALDTEMTFQSAIDAQAYGNKSLIQTGYDGYRSVAESNYDYLTDEYVAKEAGTWYVADPDVIAYYLDPRNFLNEESIFMFEKLGYDASVSDADYIAAIKGILGSSYLTAYINDFMSAGKSANVNPIYLVTLAVQETGLNGSAATSGTPFTYDGVSYGSTYNIFNIGAYTSSNPVLLGLSWAAGSGSYNRPWDTLAESIINGAAFISDGYISKGQDTTFLKKFNVNPNAYWPVHTHQYQTNIMAPMAEADKSHDAYSDSNQLDMDFIFEIPVYNNMPAETKLPSKGSQNNHLSMITVNGSNVVGFEHDKYVYDVYVSDESTSALVNGNIINGEAKVTGGGNVNLTAVETEVVLTVTAGNGDVQEYLINLVKTSGLSIPARDVVNNSSLSTDGSYVNGLSTGSDVDNLTEALLKVSSGVQISIIDVNGKSKTSGNIGTGDKITVTNGESSETFTAVVKGDNDGDGNISIADLLRVQKDILNYSELVTYNNKASDIDNNGSIDVADLLMIQKHILGYSEIK